MKVPVPPGRATVEDDGTTISISAPAGRSWMAILFYPVWFCGWAAGELFALAVLFHIRIPWMHTVPHAPPLAETAFLTLWLCGWTIGGALALYSWLWMVAGREHMQIGGSSLAIWREPIPFPPRRDFDLASVRRMRVGPAQGWLGAQARQYDPFCKGQIAFDYGSKTLHFGAGLDEAEAFELVRLIAERFPQLADLRRGEA